MARQKMLKRFPNTEQCSGSGLWRFNKIQNKKKPNEIWYRSKCVYESSEAAWLALQQRLHDVAEYGAPAVAAAQAIPTFAELAEKWIGKVVPATCKPSTALDYRIILDKHLLPVLGPKPVDQISRWDVKDLLLGKLGAGLASSTVTHIKNVISGVMATALDAGYIAGNPAKDLGRLWRDKPRGKDVCPFTRQELETLLNHFRQHQPHYFPFIATLALSGMRAGEAAGLKWEDIDYGRQTIHIKRSLSRMKLGTPKNSKTRKVAMASALARILKDHRINTVRESLARGDGKVPDFVFTNQSGGLLDINPFRARVWKPAIEAARLPARRIHDLRHTYATLRISRGDNIADVSAQLGHYNAMFTAKQYYHWQPSAEGKNQVDSLAESLGLK